MAILSKSAAAPQRYAFVLAVLYAVVFLLLIWPVVEMCQWYQEAAGGPYGPTLNGFLFMLGLYAFGYVLLGFYILEARGWWSRGRSVTWWIISIIYNGIPCIPLVIHVYHLIIYSYGGWAMYTHPQFWFSMLYFLIPVGAFALSCASLYLVLVPPGDRREL